MSPVEQAAEVYRCEPCSHGFYEALEYYLINGYVINTPEVFVMAREVSSKSDMQETINPWRNLGELTNNLKYDTWFIHLMAGDMKKAHSFFPYPHKFISFEKRNKLKHYNYERFWRTLL